MESPIVPDFTRGPGPIDLTGFRAAKLDDLQERLDLAGFHGDWVISDLTLGAWRGHQVATEFQEQLAPEPRTLRTPNGDSTYGSRHVDVSYADVIGDFIDAEARGDRAITDALGFAEQIRGMLHEGPRTFLIWVPRFGLAWEDENVQFVGFLAQAFKGTPSRLALLTPETEQPDVPPRWRVRWHGHGQQLETDFVGESLTGLVPGIIDPAVFETLRAANTDITSLIPLDRGHWLIPPERRRDPRVVSRLDFDRLGSLARSHGWLDAYAGMHGNTMYVEPWLLYAQAQQRFAEGGTGITLRLMDSAISHVRSADDWGVMRSVAQGLRLALHRFVEASQLEDSPPGLPVPTRRFLLLSKGWGLVMLGELEGAEECFQLARSLTSAEDQSQREFLYLLNISALCRLKSGDPDTALEMERTIEDAVERLALPDSRLEYVNSINLARLHRRRDEIPEAEQYFHRAFATTFGVRSDGDAIYTNVIMARLYADSSRPHEAFTCWLRAGLRWCSCDSPEAIGPRVVNAILGAGAATQSDRLEAVSAALFTEISKSASRAGVRIAGVSANGSPSFVSTGRFRASKPGAGCSRAALIHGISALATRERIAPQIDGESSRRLRAHLYALLSSGAPRDFFAPLDTMVVDDSFGREIPSTWEELLPVFVRLRTESVAANGDVITVHGATRWAIQRGLRVRLGCALELLGQKGDRTVVVFKRYLRPRILTVEESRTLSGIESGLVVGDVIDEDGPGALTILHGLEEDRVIHLDWPPDASTPVFTPG